MADLTTAAYARSLLPDLSPAEILALPATISGVSKLIQNHTGRQLARRPAADGSTGAFEEILTPPQRGPILLGEYPVNEVLRVSASPTVALIVQNDDAVTNQRAVVRITRSPQAIAEATYQGAALTLQRWASGVKLENSIDLATITPPTIARLAALINATGGGWTATAADGFASWGVAELLAGDGAQGALATDAEFVVYADDSDFECDQTAGMLTVQDGQADPFESLRFGPTAGLEFSDDEIRGRDRGLRIVYDAGYDPIPDDLQQAVVEGIKASFERKATSSTLQSERTDSWAWTARDFIDALPGPVKQVLAYYRDHAR